MRRFWLFRSNLIPLEYYHQYTDLNIFEKNCHDYYMLLPLWLLQNNYFDEVIIWRLTDKPKSDIIFNINGKQYIQRWVSNFNKTFDYPKPDISFWRGGFPEYDRVTSFQPKHFGLKLYLGAGRRQFSQYGGKYDIYLMEDERDFRSNYNCIPFYKTASPYIFYPKKSEVKWDICWPCNFTQLKYKGQEFFIETVSKSEFLKSLKIVHCGNKTEVGEQLCKKFGINNIEFIGSVDRPTLNDTLNASKFGLNLSNLSDGCPRVSTEILMSGTPLIIHEQTRLLKYYKNKGVMEVTDKDITQRIEMALEKYSFYKNQVLESIQNELSFKNTNQKNMSLWKTHIFSKNNKRAS